MRGELERVKRDERIMGMIVENYEKEVEKRKEQIAALRKEGSTPRGSKLMGFTRQSNAN
jgi:hypothetical protein